VNDLWKSTIYGLALLLCESFAALCLSVFAAALTNESVETPTTTTTTTTTRRTQVEIQGVIYPHFLFANLD